MSHIEIFPSHFLITSTDEIISKIHNEFSFKDKAAQYELVRFINSQKRVRVQGSTPDWWPAWYQNKITGLKAAIHVFAGKRDGNQLLIPTGLLARTLAMPEFANAKIDDYRNLEVNRKHLNKSTQKLRRPQEEALKAMEGKTHGLIQIPTGVGKSKIAEDFIYKKGCKTLFMAPSTSILNQMVRRLKDRFGEKLVGQYSGSKKQDKWITVATYQAIHASKDTFADVDLVISDESHHVSADTFLDAVINKVPNAVYKFGLSAHSERADGSTILVHAGVGEVIYDFSAKEAIDEGYLARPHFTIYQVTKTKGTYKKWKTANNKRVESGTAFSHPVDDKDADKAYKNWVLGNDSLSSKISKITEDFVSEGKSILILIDEKEHADKLSQYLTTEYGLCVGGGKENESILKKFNKRELKILIGTTTISEGTDVVPVDVLINLMGGASISKTKQANGRALRNDPDPITGMPRKPTCLIIDFDFPECEVLQRHSAARQEVHSEIGEITIIPLDL